MSSFLISCGGTGGHLSPGIALAEGLVARGHTVRLLISRKKVDSRLIEKYPQFTFVRVPGSGFALHPVKLARCVASQMEGLWFCRKLVRETRPDGVVGFGGFTSTSIMVAAQMAGVPVTLHEANRVPGRAVRMLGRIAKRVYLPPGVALPGVRPQVISHVGLPVRTEIRRVSAAEARAALGFDADQRLLVVFGGSQGASVLNDWVRRELPTLASNGIQVCCITGLGKGKDEVVELTTAAGAPVRMRFMVFCDRVGEVLSAADLVLSRAGAGTIAELIRCETPAVLVPFPQAADDHQRANAAYFERQGGGVVIDQTGMNTVATEVTKLIFSDELLTKFRANLRRMELANPLEFMLSDLEQIAGSKRRGVA